MLTWQLNTASITRACTKQPVYYRSLFLFYTYILYTQHSTGVDIRPVTLPVTSVNKHHIRFNNNQHNPYFYTPWRSKLNNVALSSHILSSPFFGIVFTHLILKQNDTEHQTPVPNRSHRNDATFPRVFTPPMINIQATNNTQPAFPPFPPSDMLYSTTCIPFRRFHPPSEGAFTPYPMAYGSGLHTRNTQHHCN